ncbi:hypothetical protein K450DRAFT_225686 [Umbelopsis ramanniana AG]|uniref:Transmembrane protein n=1 Tax=Umbelopsis ramanniana AG TaxID=1314678 RepID=A0AAD5EGA4_UMBRA|nr:uncharacterized protein K450DRAFT_225686 [Umbelopsis ramanniana AG]KAI8582969.1 hypothetical protein K450DRAFT_225686 [Umbelopsis ramanniana AG]
MDFTNKYTTAYIGVFTYVMWYAVNETNKLLLDETTAYYDVDFKGFDASNPPFTAWGEGIRGFYPILAFIKAAQALSFLLVTVCMMGHLNVNYKALQAVVVAKFGLDLWCIWELTQTLLSWPSFNESTLELLSKLAVPRFYFTAGLSVPLFALLFGREIVSLSQQFYTNLQIRRGKIAPEEQEKKDQ